jgi:hypothetical protein
MWLTLIITAFKNGKWLVSERGGEATLNCPWLVGYFKELKALNPDPEARLHLDSNGTVLAPDYIFPTFRRRREIRRPYLNEMLAVKRTLEQTGLKAVVVQIVVGHIGPGD